MTKQATPPQLGYIRRLASERASRFPLGVDAFMTTIQNKRLTMTGASGLIDRLQRTSADVPEGQPQRDPARRSNAYAGRCVRCGNDVAAGAGYLTGGPGNWGCEHLEGQCPEAVAETTTSHRPSEIIGDIPDGHYAVPSWTANTDVLFFTIGTNKGVYRPERKGQRFIKQVIGGHEDMLAYNDTLIERAVDAIRSQGVTESMALYGVELGQCGKCGRHLTSEWRKRGIGPECSKKVGL